MAVAEAAAAVTAVAVEVVAVEVVAAVATQLLHRCKHTIENIIRFLLELSMKVVFKDCMI